LLIYGLKGFQGDSRRQHGKSDIFTWKKFARLKSASKTILESLNHNLKLCLYREPSREEDDIFDEIDAVPGQGLALSVYGFDQEVELSRRMVISFSYSYILLSWSGKAEKDFLNSFAFCARSVAVYIFFPGTRYRGRHLWPPFPASGMVPDPVIQVIFPHRLLPGRHGAFHG